MKSGPAQNAVKISAVAFILVAAAVCTARADERDTPPEDTPRVVLLANSGDKESFDSIVRAIRGQISDLPVEFQVVWLDAMPSKFSTQEEAARKEAEKIDASAVFWCDLTQTDKMYLYVAVPKLDRVLVRRLDGSGPGGTSETIAIITRSSIEAMLKDSSTMDDQGWETSTVQEREEGEPVVAEPEPAIETDQELGDDSRISLEAAYAIDVVSWDHPAVQGLYLALDVRLADHWHIFAGYTFFASMKSQKSDVELVLRRHPILVGGRIIGPIGHMRPMGLIKQVEMGFIAAVSLDYLTEKIRETAPEPSLALADDGAEVSVSLMPQMYLGLKVVSTIRIFACLGADIPLRKIDYLVDEYNVDTIIVFESWPVRPVGRLGLSGGF